MSIGHEVGLSYREKIDTYVDFPIDGLNMNPYCSSFRANEKKNSNTTKIYDLIGVINHYGRMGFGHYTAYCRDWVGDQLDDTWRCYDDDHVTVVDKSKIKTKAAYILFYKKR